MSGRNPDPKPKEDKKEEESDLNDRIDDSIEERDNRRGDSDFEEDEDAFRSDEEDHKTPSRDTGRRNPPPPDSREDDDPSGTLRSNEGDGLIERQPGEPDEKYNPVQFKPITSEADPKDFDLKANNRFGFMERMAKA